MTAAPSTTLWSTLDVTPGAELHAGHQSQVFRATGRSGDVVVKLVEADRADDGYRNRIELVAGLAEAHPAVVGPIAIGSDLVVEVEGWLAVCYPFVEGSEPDTDDPGEAAAMGTALAELHAVLADPPTAAGRPRPTTTALPPVPALRTDAPESQLSDRLIHGDFGATNLIVTGDGLRIIDFDDCGRGTVEFELGNTLYMGWFDAWNADDHDRYQRFRGPFLDAYRQTAAEPVDDALIAEASTVRLDALDHWLTNPADAPTGIRNASSAWRARLRTFVEHSRGQPNW